MPSRSSASRVLVTGAGQGLGHETARQLEALGCEVIRTARRPQAGEVQLDVTDRASIEAAARSVGPIDVLVNNAGIAMRGFDAHVAEQTLAVNFFGARAVTERFPIRDGGRVVMVSSGVGELANMPKAVRAKLDPPPAEATLVALMRRFVDDVRAGVHAERGWPQSAYGVSKVGLNTLARILAVELAPRGIRVVSVCPGWVRTRMGGRSAPRSVQEGAKGIVWAATAPEVTTGTFYRDRRPIPW